jgi:hypothetical protein
MSEALITPGPLGEPGCRPGQAHTGIQTERTVNMEGHKSGGQRGNTNALKHGFYSRKFRVLEKGDLEGMEDPNHLKDEMMLLKAVIRRVWEFSSDGTQDLDSWISALNVLGLAVSRQARVLWLQSQFDKANGSDSTKAMSEALKKIMDEVTGSK